MDKGYFVGMARNFTQDSDGAEWRDEGIGPVNKPAQGKPGCAGNKRMRYECGF